MQTQELLSKLDLIEHARNTMADTKQQLANERQQMIIALVKQIRWILAEDTLSRTGPEATVRMSS
jgi:hypothetical protein